MWKHSIGLFVFLPFSFGCGTGQHDLVEGRVFLDLDGDGVFSAGDEAVANAIVFWETKPFATTNEDGYFSDLPPGRGIVWVRSPDQAAPGPVWAHIEGPATLDLPLRPAVGRDPLVFVAASDSHTGLDRLVLDELVQSLWQATDIVPQPHFVVMTGDITQSNAPDQFQMVLDATAGFATPYVPVPGNHDWYDGGEAYRSFFGPPTYSFDAGGVHFVVLNDAASFDARVEFLGRDLELTDEDRMVVAFMHSPPEPPLTAALEAAGVDYLFTGHMHANRVLDHGGMLEYNTQPFVMGGIDHTPAGYRMATLADGQLELTHFTVTERPTVELAVPGMDAAICACPLSIAATLAGIGPIHGVMAVVDGSTQVPLTRGGGWGYEGRVDLCETGTHELALLIDGGSGPVEQLSASFTVSDEVEVLPDGYRADWAQQHGGATHHGYFAHEVSPPLREVWRRHLGQHLHGGSPVIANGRVYVSLVDFADGNGGGLVALDLESGNIQWRHPTGRSVRSAPAVSDGIVVFASLDGVIHALSADSGAPVWTYDLAAVLEDPRRRNIYASPVIADGVVYAGILRELVALDLESGIPLWSIEPYNIGGEGSTYASIAVASGVVIATVARGTRGLHAFDPQTGAELWRSPPHVTEGGESAPIVVGDTVYVTNWLTELYALNLFDGEIRWSRKLNADGFPWAYGILATPAYADGVLYVPTTFGHLHAIDAASGQEKWRLEADDGFVHAAHYQGRSQAFTSAPIVTGRTLWVGGPDGRLRAIDPVTGEPLWSFELPVPILMSPAPAGDALILGTYDGTIRALTPLPEVRYRPCPLTRRPHSGQ